MSSLSQSRKYLSRYGEAYGPVIGSEPVGKKVAAAAAEIMVPTCIELGGKDPEFLLPSVDLDYFVSHYLRGVL